MTSYISLPNGAVAAGGLPSGETVTALRDNPIAIGEGAPGAPRIAIGAVARVSAGAEIRSRVDTTQTKTTAGYGTAHRFAMLQSGTVRVTLEHRQNGGVAGDVSVDRVRNGVTVSVTWAHPAVFTARSTDVNVLPGDVVLIKHQTGAPPNASEIRNVRIQTNGEDLWPGEPGPIEGNTYNS